MEPAKIFEEWMTSLPENDPLRAELHSVADKDGELVERFGSVIAFGTAGLRGIYGAGTAIRSPVRQRESPLIFFNPARIRPADSCWLMTAAIILQNLQNYQRSSLPHPGSEVIYSPLCGRHPNFRSQSVIGMRSAAST